MTEANQEKKLYARLSTKLLEDFDKKCGIIPRSKVVRALIEQLISGEVEIHVYSLTEPVGEHEEALYMRISKKLLDDFVKKCKIFQIPQVRSKVIRELMKQFISGKAKI